MASAKGRFDPIGEDSHLLGEVCRLCQRPLEVGQRPTLIGDDPADAEEAAKKAAGRAYTAVASVVHETCVYDGEEG